MSVPEIRLLTATFSGADCTDTKLFEQGTAHCAAHPPHFRRKSQNCSTGIYIPCRRLLQAFVRGVLRQLCVGLVQLRSAALVAIQGNTLHFGARLLSVASAAATRAPLIVCRSFGADSYRSSLLFNLHTRQPYGVSSAMHTAVLNIGFHSRSSTSPASLTMCAAELMAL